MKNFALALAGGVMATGFVAIAPAPVEASSGPFDKIKKKVKKAKKAAADAEAVVDTVDRANRTNGRSVVNGVVNGTTRTGGSSTSNSPRTGSRYKGHKGIAGAAPAKYVQQINCANLGLGNAFVARDGEYTFSQGLNTETRGGLIDRKPVQPTNGCLFPAMGVGDVLYVEFDKAKYEGDKRNYDLQCVSYDGSQQLGRGDRPPADNYKGKDVMLHTGHSLGYTPTASGTNSSRSGAYNKYLDGRGRSMLTFNMPPLHTDRGTDFFCQHYNKNTGKIALAFTFRRGPGS